jgi:hypothetical protein
MYFWLVLNDPGPFRPELPRVNISKLGKPTRNTDHVVQQGARRSSAIAIGITAVPALSLPEKEFPSQVDQGGSKCYIYENVLHHAKAWKTE